MIKRKGLYLVVFEVRTLLATLVSILLYRQSVKKGGRNRCRRKNTWMFVFVFPRLVILMPQKVNPHIYLCLFSTPPSWLYYLLTACSQLFKVYFLSKLTWLLLFQHIKQLMITQPVDLDSLNCLICAFMLIMLVSL